MNIWIPALFAFLLGSIPFGLLIAKSQGINIREHGSGNIGATNVLRIVGKPFGISCFVLDFFKGFIPSAVGLSLISYVGHQHGISWGFLEPYATEFPAEQRSTAQSFQLMVGLLAILGHNYSPWVGFKGGKGIATSAGVFCAFAPALIPVLVVVWLLFFLITRYVSVASIAASIALPVAVIYGSWYHGKIANGTWNQPLFYFSIFIGLMAVYKHRSNIKNLMNGTEHKFTPKKKQPK
ncbi:glycerol-3-phosphate 1-O-acyltransferase PlsY [Rubritalea marina]|uniref:glycerol-3-phosphate 1-O-acyltransferase PlsY n=1 Tax=Rubritalea marina TaxID=361055 RepID=UPI0003637048|nr:glycerol-3-phosphate 1-O-acyltransferase PlsY [Rubritalea marina]